MKEAPPLWRIPQWFQGLDQKKRELLRSYHLELCKWTKAVNLISQGTIFESDKIHIADGILGCQAFIDELPEGSEVWDLGSGNGIPGVVLSILKPECKVVCLDSDDRKMSFVKQLSLKLDLANLETRVGRVEDIEPRSLFFGTARGLARLPKLLKICGEIFGQKAVFFCFKGQDFQEELNEVPAEIQKTWKTGVINQYSLPENGGNRAILRVERL